MTEGAIGAAPAWFAIVPVLGAALLVFIDVRFAHSRKRAGMQVLNSTVIWNAAFIATLLGVALFCLMRLFDGAIWMLALFTLAMVLLGSLTNLRDKVLASMKACETQEDLDRKSLRIAVRDLLIVLAATILSIYAMELPYNNWAFGIDFPYYIIEFVIVLCVISCLFLLFGRRGWGSAIGTVALTFIGLSQYFLYMFKMVAIMPADLLVLDTALSVSGNYDYIINGFVLLGVGFAAASFCVLSFAIPPQVKCEKSKKWVKRALNVAGAAVIAACLAYFVTVPDYAKEAEIKIDSWFTYDSYKAHGFLTSFITVAQDMAVDKPAGYTKEGTEELVSKAAREYDESQKADGGMEAAQAQFEEKQPVVVAVMNETFCDLSIYDNLRCDYEGPEFYKSLCEDAIASGLCTVSAYGGGTCNTEFEFLTGNNMAFFGKGMFPYSTYDFDGVENLAKQFNELGYTTSAMHPNAPTNWSREKNYEKMGFEHFYSIDDFPQQSKIHQEVSDFETYDKILEIIEGSDDPQFIFDVTMQNHSGYAREGIPDEYKMDVHPQGIDDEKIVGELNEYLGCIKASDAALEEFIGKLEKLDRPVFLVFFGDHQPAFAKDINDAFFPNEDQATHEQRPYCSSYFIWANYEVEGADRLKDLDRVSSSNLPAIALDAVGVPTSDYEKMLLKCRNTVPAFNLFGCCDVNQKWYSFEEENVPADCEETLDLLERAQYARFIDNK